MTTAIEISELGMLNDLRQLAIISQNLANANTPGYKRNLAIAGDFDRLLADNLASRSNRIDLASQWLPPPVVPLTDHGAGVLRHSGNPLDLAVEGNAYLELSGEAGPRYTRSGSFGIDAGGRLSNAHGLAVMGLEGEILLQGGEISIDREGIVSEDGEYAGQLKLVSFADTSRLVRSGRGLWQAAAGQAGQATTGAGVRQGYQEASNVAVMDEMVRMMSTLRHFETTSRVIKGYDEMLSTAISTIAEF